MEKCENFENIHRFLAAKNHHEFAKIKKTKSEKQICTQKCKNPK